MDPQGSSPLYRGSYVCVYSKSTYHNDISIFLLQALEKKCFLHFSNISQKKDELYLYKLNISSH